MHKELCTEAINALEALRDSDVNFTVGEVQLYLTDVDGLIMELCIGIDDDGEVRKSMSHYDDLDELRTARDEQFSDDLQEQGLLN
ncbi:uncharacterized protein METZ01_LOCUS494265 [marine metagenome]|jgi:hypothetical protein|uniref:Uncharacterized protein n=1 Tax=marine metagenome TaxID=408172 RepID=A0A383DAQ7_9ZZZZ|tara:strand:- start:302 stop:556 length:255 start_codon:yes stop_codon:yes gene_type:complete